MAIAKRSIARTAFTSPVTSGQNIVISKPTGCASGDVVYIGVGLGGASSNVNAGTDLIAGVGSSGFTLLGSKIAYIPGQSFGSTVWVFRRKCDGSEGSTFTFTTSGVSGGFSFYEMYAVCLTGVDQTTQEDVTSTGTSGDVVGGAVGQTTQWPSMTPVTNGNWLLAYESCWDACSWVLPTGTNPTSLAYEYNGGGTSSTDGAGLLGLFIGTQATAGATGLISTTNNGNNGTSLGTSDWASFLVAVRPAAAGAGSMLPLNPMQQQLNQLLAR